MALNAALDLNQYAHNAWRVREGFANGRRILSLAQTSDGILWLGTESGLFRFDGVRASSWQPPPGASLSTTGALLAAGNGDLWIGSTVGLARLTHGQFVTYPPLEGSFAFGLAEDRQGTLWVGVYSFDAASPGSSLCAIRDRRTECYGRDGRFGARMGAPLQDRHGNLWVATAMGLWRWQPGPPQLYPLPDAVADIPTFRSLAETPRGVLVLTGNGLDEFVDGSVTHHWAAEPLSWHPNVALTDRDGAVWIGTTDHGLVHLHDGRMDTFSRADGLSGDDIQALLEDREGNMWVATDGGLDRFRTFAATIYSAPQGITGLKGSLLADRNGSMWFSTSSGLYHWAGGRFTAYGARKTTVQTTSRDSARLPPVTELSIRGFPEPSTGSLFQDHLGRVWLGTVSGLGYLENNRFVLVDGVPRGYIDAITEDQHGNLWVAHRDVLLELAAGHIVKRISWAAIGLSGSGYRLAVDPVLGGLWIGSSSGRAIHFDDGRVQTSYGPAEGLPKAQINEIRVRPDGTVWVATTGGLSRLKHARFVTLDQKRGLPCDHVDSTVEDDDGSLWLYMSCGLSRISALDLQSWSARRDGQVTLSKVTVLDTSDGIGFGAVLPTFSPHIGKSADGKLWVLTIDGPAEIDPNHLPFNNVPPPVHVDQIIADRTSYAVGPPLILPPIVREIEMVYTALSLVAPE
jgi:ligand-binding sensor domain-containing protein